MKENIIRDKCFTFAVKIVHFVRDLKAKKVETSITNQLLKSGTSIAANVEEASGAISRAEFSTKLSIAFKEARETNFWIKLLLETKTISGSQYHFISDDCTEIEKILYSILKTIREEKCKK